MSYNHGISFTLLCLGKDQRWHLERKRKTVEGGCICFVHVGQSEPVDTQCEASYWWKEQHSTRVTCNATLCSAVQLKEEISTSDKTATCAAACFPASSSFLFQSLTAFWFYFFMYTCKISVCLRLEPVQTRDDRSSGVILQKNFNLI